MVYHCHSFSLIHALAVGRIRTAINTAPPGSLHFCPHFCVGFLFLVVHSRASCLLLLLPPPPPTQLTHTQLPHTHDLLTHATYSHTTCSHTHLHNLLIHNLLTHTHNLLTLNLLTHNLLTHTTCSLATCSTSAGVATCSHMDRHFAWQAWQLTGTGLASGGATWALTFGATWYARRTVCVAGNLFDASTSSLVRLYCVAQRTHLATSSHVNLCVAGVVLHRQLTHVHSAWQVWHLWHLWHWAPSLGSRFGPVVAAAVCVAGVAIGDIDLHFAWQAWHMWHLATSTCTLCGRCGTYGTGLALVARLGLGDAASFCV